MQRKNLDRAGIGKQEVLKELRHCSCILKKLATLFKIIIFNLFQSSPSSAILVPFCLSLESTLSCFSSLAKPLFLGFPAL